MDSLYLVQLCAKHGIDFDGNVPDYGHKKASKSMSFRDVNAKLLKDVHNAIRLGISYGEYKASEEVWRKRIRILELTEERKCKDEGKSK